MCAVYNTEVMKSLRSWRFACVVSLLAGVILLCLGTFLSWPTTGAEAHTSPTKADSPQVDQGANGYGHSLNGGYLAVPAEETEEDRGPANASLLTTLLLVVFFGTALSWLPALGWTRRTPEVFSLLRHCFPFLVRRHQRRHIAALLGVFRL